MKNHVLPFGIIAFVGIFIAVIVFYLGVHQREDIRLAEEGGEVAENGEVTEEALEDPEAIYAKSCAGCHGDDLSGAMGPGLQTIGSSLSADDIQNVIVNGQGTTMPGGLVSNEEAAVLAEWLSEMK